MEGTNFDKAIGLAYLVGSYKLLSWTISGLKYFKRQFIRPLLQSRTHLYNKYGLKQELSSLSELLEVRSCDTNYYKSTILPYISL